LLAPFPRPAASLAPERLHQLGHFDGDAAVTYPGHRFLLLTLLFFLDKQKDHAGRCRTIL
jgi:hypothetical protein